MFSYVRIQKKMKWMGWSKQKNKVQSKHTTQNIQRKSVFICIWHLMKTGKKECSFLKCVYFGSWKYRKKAQPLHHVNCKRVCERKREGRGGKARAANWKIKSAAQRSTKWNVIRNHAAGFVLSVNGIYISLSHLVGRKMWNRKGASQPTRTFVVVLRRIIFFLSSVFDFLAAWGRWKLLLFLTLGTRGSIFSVAVFRTYFSTTLSYSHEKKNGKLMENWKWYWFFFAVAALVFLSFMRHSLKVRTPHIRRWTLNNAFQVACRTKLFFSTAFSLSLPNALNFLFFSLTCKLWNMSSRF